MAFESDSEARAAGFRPCKVGCCGRPLISKGQLAKAKDWEAGWAYLRPYYSNRERLDTLPRFLAYYNHRRPHGGIGGATPTSRL